MRYLFLFYLLASSSPIIAASIDSTVSTLASDDSSGSEIYHKTKDSHQSIVKVPEAIPLVVLCILGLVVSSICPPLLLVFVPLLCIGLLILFIGDGNG